MPFTPFHLGPGAFLKAIGGEQFSFMIFGGSQVLMDVEPLIRIIRGDNVLHGLSHTIVGAFAIGVLAAIVGRPVSNIALRHSGILLQPINWRVAGVSAFIGTYSHIGLDAIMHGDMNPLWPIALGNDLLDIISVEMLHLLCVLSGLVGGGVVAIRYARDA